MVQSKAENLKPIFSAILLAAGRSSRMGAFKPLLPFGDQSVIRACIKNLQSAGVSDIVVVVGPQSDGIRRDLRDSNVRFAVNPFPESEMNASIMFGVKTLEQTSGAVLIALADHPAVGPGVIEVVIREWTTGAKLVIPQYGARGGHPVLVDLEFRDELMNLDPEGGLRSFFARYKGEVRRVSVESPFIARDMDTWDDYCALHQEIFGYLPQVQPPRPGKSN